MTTEMQTRPVELLLVEDSPGDVRLTIEALKEGRVINNLTVVQDGEEAIAFLRRQGQHAGAPAGPADTRARVSTLARRVPT